MNQILSKIYRNDIYAEFIPLEESISGWGGNDPIFEQLVDRIRPRVVFEVGCWKGQSTITLADACKRRQLNCSIVCIDTWLGSEEHIFGNARQLKRVNGYPTLYRQFLSNIVRRGHQDIVVPLATTSLSAASILDKLQITADLVYIDANHRYEAVMADLVAFTSLVSKSGLIFGHDYDRESVRHALCDFCNTTRQTYTVQNDFWILLK